MTTEAQRAELDEGRRTSFALGCLLWYVVTVVTLISLAVLLA